MNMAEKCDGVKKLWKQCFNDSDEFVDFYFEKKYKEENTIIIEYENEIVSALQMIPYSMTWNGKQIEVSYISGASTHPDFRNKGLMRKLLTEAFIITKSRRIALSILIPQEEWLTKFYEKSGYASVFGYTPEQYNLNTDNPDNAVQALSKEECNLRLKELYDYFACYMLDCNYCVLHDFDDFLIILEEMYLDGGNVFIYKDNNDVIKGMALAVPQNEVIQIKELLYEGEKEKQALLYTISNKWDNGNIIYNARPQFPNIVKKGMARVIDARQLLNLYAENHPEETLTIKLNDDILASNNGHFIIDKGECKKREDETGKWDIEMNMNELVCKLFESTAYMSLMLD